MTEREIFIAALARPAAERPAYLDTACGADPALRRRLDRLLALSDAECPLLDAPAAEIPKTPPPADSPDRVLAQVAPLLGPSPRPGALGRLGHYDVLEVLGRGGCGIVLRAIDDKLHRVVAVKVLAPHLAATSPPRQRFLREARAAAQVRDEHVVQVYAVEEEPLPYLVMEFVGGESLQQRLDRIGPRPAAEVARIGRQVALGLAAAHARGLVHRDVKPANVLLEPGPDPRAKLTDFGLARAADDASLTQSGVLAGTPMYMSPEQARGGEVLDHRADLFSLGSVLYTMAAGRPPFRAATAFAVLKRVVEDAPRPIREVIGDVPTGLVAVIDRLMAKDPDERFATAVEAADALGKCLTDPSAVVPARRAFPVRRVAAGVGLLTAVVGVAWAASHFARPAGDVAQAQPTGPQVATVPTATLPPPSTAAKPTAEPAVPANALVVTSTADDDTPGTLRWAVEQANSRAGEDTVVFDPKAFATPQTITLTRELRLTDTAYTAILGPPAGLTLTGEPGTRGFFVHADGPSPATATLRGLTLSGFNLGTGNGSRAAGIYVIKGDLALDRVTVADCFANFTAGMGIEAEGAVRMTNCTVSRNRATAGSGVYNTGTLTAVNSTFSGNHSDGNGAAICNNPKARVKLIGCTVTANEAGRQGGGVRNDTGGTVTLVNTIVAGNRGESEPDLSGAFTANHCLIGSSDGTELLTGSGRNVTGESARLGPLRDNGGPTETHLPLADSPAIDAADKDGVPANVRTDQRGKPRAAGAGVDVGAVERE